MNFLDVPQRPGVDVFDDLVRAFGGVVLIAHLGDDFVFLRGFAERARFAQCVGQRLFDVDMLAERHRQDRGRRVAMIRRGDDDAVDVFIHLIEHLAEVGVGLRRCLFRGLPRGGFVKLALRMFDGIGIDIA